jgi:pyrophosphatase PpaX
LLNEQQLSQQQPITCLLFDLDGTVLDTEAVIVESFQYTVELYTGRRPTPAELAPIFGLPLRDQMAMFVPDKADEMCAKYVEHNLREHPRLVKPYPRIPEVLTELEQRGYRLAVVTSKRQRATEFGLNLFALRAHFPIMVCADHVTRHKPDPEPVQRALEALHVQPAEALMIGDSPWDIAAGRRAGTRTAAALYGMYDRNAVLAELPDFRLEQPIELLDICPRLELDSSH